MLILDAHCDTLSEVLDKKIDLFQNSGQLDLKRLYENKNSVQFFAVFIKPGHSAYALTEALKLIDLLKQAAVQYPETMEIALDTKDIRRITSEGKVAAIISIEGGDALSGELSVLRMLHELGVRALGLTWNYRNQIADGVLDDTGGGLTPFGKSVVSEMNRLRMLIDVSHINKKGFWDVLEQSKNPIIASHSNAQTLCGHVRNLDDNQLLALKENGGVTGMNFCPAFLRDDQQATIDDVIKHIEYIAGLIGIEHIGLGSDFDGIARTPTGLEGVQCLPDLINRLFRLNYTKQQVEMIAGGNFMRVLQKVIG
ncbi:MAG TPA: peptidase [Clostridiales bacterium]|nr:peptidase [Clostridiales bacterium]